MALDEPKDNDVTFVEQGITFAIEEELFEEAKPIRIDYVDSLAGGGFQLTSSLSSAGGCG